MPRPEETPEVQSLRTHLAVAGPIGLAVAAFGVTFGVLAVASGVTISQTIALSLFTFTGASQFAAIGVLAGGGTPLAAMTGALLLGARNAVYGLTVADIARGGALRRLLAAHLVIDESTAVATAQANIADARRGFWVTGILVGTTWNIGTAIGALFGQAIGDPAALGLDAAFPAAFLALVVPRLRQRPELVAGVIGGAVALVLIPVTPPGIPILAATAAVIPAWLTSDRARR